MALPCFPDDHLFLVFEEDFRFYKSDAEADIASSELRPEPRTTAASSSRDRPGSTAELVASGAPNESQFWAEAVGPRGEQRVHDFFYVSPVRLARGDITEVATELEDLVAICNAVGRLGRGGCVWLGWNASVDRKYQAANRARIANGSQLIGFTTAGARFLCANWPSAPPAVT